MRAGLLQPLPVKLEYNGAVDNGKTQQPDPAESDAAEHTGLEVQDEDLFGGEMGGKNGCFPLHSYYVPGLLTPL